MSLRERFERNFIPVTESGCWLWLGRLDGGYGRLRITGNPKDTPALAHRVSWEMAHGEIPNGLCVCHRCDVRSCINPAHLFLGTYTDNMQDAARKGRMKWKSGKKRDLPVGSKHHAAKIAETDVKAIRDSTATGVELSKRYGITPTVVCKIRKRKLWRHVA